jgi:hypothetical protein
VSNTWAPVPPAEDIVSSFVRIAGDIRLDSPEFRVQILDVTEDERSIMKTSTERDIERNILLNHRDRLCALVTLVFLF